MLLNETADRRGVLTEIHPRMPLVLPPHAWRQWLAGDVAVARTLLDPPPPAYLAGLEIRPVGTAVGDVRNDGPRLVEPSELWDKTFAHKPWVLKHDGVVYHYYCAVGNEGRCIALATSRRMS